MTSYEDDFDRMEDDVDYGGIGEEEWVALNTQPSQILSTSTSRSSTRISRDSSQQPESNVPERMFPRALFMWHQDIHLSC